MPRAEIKSGHMLSVERQNIHDPSVTRIIGAYALTALQLQRL